MMDLEPFGEGYFERGIGSNYYSYSWRPELILPRVDAIIHAAGVSSDNIVLDYGCAKGYYVKAMRLRGLLAIGMDASQYAIANADPAIAEFVFSIRDVPLYHITSNSFDLVLAKDVLEHISIEHLPSILRHLRRIGHQVVITVPICNKSRRFINPTDENDRSHVIRLTRREWLYVLRPALEDQSLAIALKGAMALGTLCAHLE